MKQGEGLRFECNYQNTEDRALRFGTSATDEMCVLFGMIWNAGCRSRCAAAELRYHIPRRGRDWPRDRRRRLPESSSGRGRPVRLRRSRRRMPQLPMWLLAPNRCIKCATDADCNPSWTAFRTPRRRIVPRWSTHTPRRSGCYFKPAPAWERAAATRCVLTDVMTPRRPPNGSIRHSSICVPISITRSGGIPKNDVAG